MNSKIFSTKNLATINDKKYFIGKLKDSSYRENNNPSRSFIRIGKLPPSTIPVDQAAQA
jgi:hypothetical protein